jgi:hypothetical protein
VSKVKLKVDIADYREAYLRQHFVNGWDRIEADARCIAAERALKENARKTDEAIKACEAMPLGPGYLKAHDRITALFKEHDELLDIAFPKSAKANP